MYGLRVPAARDLKLMLLACALFLVLVGGVWAGGANPDLLLFAPLFVLLVPLLSGRYVGEEALGRLAAAYAARRRRAPAALGLPLRHRLTSDAFRTRLVAGARFCRPPPAGHAPI